MFVRTKITCLWMLLLAMLLCLSSTATAKNMTKLVVGYLEAPQYLIIDPEASIGIDYELLHKFSQRYHLTIEFKKYQHTTELMQAVASQEVDVGAGHLTNLVSNPYAKVQASTPYQQEPLVIVTNAKHHASSVSYPSANDTVYHAIAKYPIPSDYIPEMQLATYQQANDIALFHLVARGKLDYAILPRNTALALIQIYPTVKLLNVADVTVDNVFYATSPNLLRALNDFIAGFTHTIEFQHIVYNNFNALQRHQRQESFIFIHNMKTKFGKYQGLFKKYATSMDWRLAMALAYQESRWTADIESPWGPSGFMMLTNRTAASLGVTNKLDARQSISKGVTLLMTFKNNLLASMKGYNRDMFAVANYNQGIAKIIDARTWLKAHRFDPNSWVALAQNYPKMTASKHKYGKINGQLGADYVNGTRHWYYMIINYLHFYQE